jgi:RNA polymerase sigma-70 factor (ECF subfamily)
MNNSLRRNIDEAKVMSLLRDGNPQAIEMLYDRFAAVLYGIILRTVKDEAWAPELLKQTFIYIWKNHSEFDESRQNLTQWTIGIARKIAIEKIPFPSYARNHNGSYNVNHSQAGQFFEQGQARSTSNKTNLMSAEEIKVLDLIFFGGGKIPEVADHLGINETKVKHLLQTAVNHYRKERGEAWK